LSDLNGADFVVVVQVAGDFQPEMGAGLALHPDKPEVDKVSGHYRVLSALSHSHPNGICSLCDSL
jgi:hypothetical protein